MQAGANLKNREKEGNPMKQKRLPLTAIALLTGFLLWTTAVCLVDVQPIGPLGSPVGFATLNRAFHQLTGVHMDLYALTDTLSLLPIALALGFALLGAFQWVTRKRLLLVDRSILALGGCYLAMAAAEVLFRWLPVNTRPVLIDGVSEASYPSSTTLLAMTIGLTAMLQLHRRIRKPALRRTINGMLGLFTAGMVLLRLVSGVHWLTDIAGGILLSGGLAALYAFFCKE